MELAAHNAKFIDAMREHSGCIPNSRHLKFVFAAQMYGAGKTRLGSEFLVVLSRLIADENILKKYAIDGVAYTPSLFSILQHFVHAKYVKFALTGSDSTFDSFVSGLELGQCSFTSFLCDVCDVAESDVFFHVDEVGSMNAVELRQLRDAFYSFVKKRAALKELNSNIPFFFFSGRGAPYDELGSITSPIGSHWLILEPLKIEHVRHLIKTASYCGGHKFKFCNSLTPEQFDNTVKHLIRWTGGAPRPLLYSIHMLDVLCQQNPEFINHCKSNDGLKVIFRRLLEFICSNPSINRDLGPVVPGLNSLTSRQQAAYDLFCLLSFFGKTC